MPFRTRRTRAGLAGGTQRGNANVTEAGSERLNDSLDQALEAAQRFLAARPRSEDEVRRRLSRGQFAPETVEAALVRLRQAGLVDDAAFASYWLEQRQTFRPRGARLLRAELRQRGIATELAAEAADTSQESAQDAAYRAAFKRATQLVTADERTFRTKVGQLLARRGFDWDTIAPVVARLWSERRLSS